MERFFSITPAWLILFFCFALLFMRTSSHTNVFLDPMMAGCSFIWSLPSSILTTWPHGPLPFTDTKCCNYQTIHWASFRSDPTKKLCGSKTKWSSASQGQGHRVRNMRERGKQPWVPSLRAARIRWQSCWLLHGHQLGLQWDNTTPSPPPIHFSCMFPAITFFTLAISTDLELVQIKPFCSSPLHSLMWTGAETWASKVKG